MVDRLDDVDGRPADPAADARRAAGLMDSREAALAVGVSYGPPIWRLFARRRIPSSQNPYGTVTTADGQIVDVPESGPYVCKASDVGAYVAAGCIDRDGPVVSGDGLFDASEPDAVFLQRAAQAGLPTASQIEAVAEFSPSSGWIASWQVAITPALRAAIRTMTGLEFLKAKLRVAANKRVLKKCPFRISSNPPAAMYSSPRAYEAISAAAVDFVRQGTAASWSAIVKIPPRASESEPATTNIKPGKNIAVSYALDMRELINDFHGDRLAELAF